MLIGMLSGVAPAYANTVTACTQGPSGTISVPAGGSTVVSYTVTYHGFGASNHPMTISASGVTAGYTINSSSFNPLTSSGTHTHTFHLLVSNTNPSVLSGTATINLTWPGGEGVFGTAACGSMSMNTKVFPPPTVPEFPFGMLLVIAVALPAMLLLKKKQQIV